MLHLLASFLPLSDAKARLTMDVELIEVISFIFLPRVRENIYIYNGNIHKLQPNQNKLKTAISKQVVLLRGSKKRKHKLIDNDWSR